MKPTKSNEISRKSNTGEIVKRNKQFYLNNLDVESTLLTRAISLAERMFTSFIREQNINVKVDTSSLADEIIKKLEPKLSRLKVNEVRYLDEGSNLTDDFKFIDNDPVVVKTEKVEIKGKIGKKELSEDSISSNLDMLEGISI